MSCRLICIKCDMVCLAAGCHLHACCLHCQNTQMAHEIHDNPHTCIEVSDKSKPDDSRTAIIQVNANLNAELRKVKEESFSAMQKEIGEWGEHNFPKMQPHHAFLGVVEEVGEFAHSLLKSEMGIRGSVKEHEEKMKDAVADAAIFAMHLCAMKKWDFEQLVRETWAVVRKRDFRKFPGNGVSE